jgi:ATP-binding cassette subfamily C protein CydCD
MYFDGRLWAFTEGARLRIAMTVAIGFLAAVTGIARLALMGWLLAEIFAGAPVERLMMLVLAMVGVMLLRAVLQYFKDMSAHKTAAAVQLRMRRRLYDKVMALGPAYFGEERTGDLILSLVDGIDQLEIYFGLYIPQFIIAGLTPIALFIFMAFLDVPIAFAFTGSALVTLLAPSIFHRWNRRVSIRRRSAYGNFAAEFLDAIQGLATLKSFGQSWARGEVLAHRARELFRSTMWVLATNSATGGVTIAGIAIGAAVALGWGAFRVEAGAMQLSHLLIILMLGTEVFRPLRELAQQLHNGMVGMSAAEGVLKLLAVDPTIREDAAGFDDSALEPAVAFENVTFAYPGGRRAAHEGLDFTVAAGERVGIVGASGAGKSSIVRLLLRLYDPQSGRVTIGGTDLRDLGLERLRGMIAVVNQDTYLFHGTVEDNLRLGKPEASQAELETAARAANAHDFIMRLPQGYQTVVGERGIRLSGGQRQRVAIARALLRDAPILILDEALSAIDAENEAVIQDALDRLMRGRTTLIFAHRLSSVINSHRILVLEHGRLVQSGSHAELIARDGAYHRLMAEQVQDSREGAAMAEIASDRMIATDEDFEGHDHVAQMEPTDAIIRAEGMGWLGTARVLLKLIAPWKAKLVATFLFGITRVLALIGVGAVSGLVVAAIKLGDPFGALLVALAVVAPLAAILHWLESWVAHDVAFRLLSEMRIDLFRKLDALAPAYLTRRRTGDLVAMATQDVETIEYFFAHTIAPAFVAVLVPGVVLVILVAYGWPLALALSPFLLLVGLSPFLARHRVDRAGSRSREALARLNAHAVETIQGLGEIVAFQQAERRGDEFDALARDHIRARWPFLRDITLQKVLLDGATGFGGLAIVGVGAGLVNAGMLDSAFLPLLTLLAMSAFLPVAEIANIGRLLADTLASTRRVYAIHDEEVAVTDGPGVVDQESVAALEMQHVSFAYRGSRRSALEDVSFSVPAGSTVALVGPSGAGKTVTICATSGSTTCATASHWWRRTLICSTTRFAPTFCWRDRTPAPPSLTTRSNTPRSPNSSTRCRTISTPW